MNNTKYPQDRSESSATAKDAKSAPKRYPIIGVVTPVRNRKDWSVAFARMFCQQNYPLFRLYVVDSDSTDGTPEAIRALGLAPVVVIDAPSSAYWTAATNAGVKRAILDNCDYILTINDDAVIPDDFLSRLVDAAIGAGARIVGSVICYVDEPGRLWGVGAYNDWKSGAFLQTRMANIWDDALDGDAGSHPSLIQVDYLCGNGTLVHRSVFDEIGLYNEKFTPHYHADTELTMRAERFGIARFVALDARLYNRFSESNDGVFAMKNIRLFSLRSVNYLRSVLFILHEYCPPRFRVDAFVRYLGRHLRALDARTHSKVLRAIRLLSGAPLESFECATALRPPLDPDLMFAEDVEILNELPPYEFVSAAFAYLLHRPCSDCELDAYGDVVRNGKPRDEVLAKIIGSEEHKAVAGTAFPYRATLVALRAHGAASSVPMPADISPPQNAILSVWRATGKIPSRTEFRAAIAALETSLRLGDGFKSDCAEDSGPIIDRDGDACDMAAPRREKDPSGRSIGAAQAAVYYNIDVLCMAITDSRAATGVHRYVLSLLGELLADGRVDVRMFFSEGLREHWEKLMLMYPTWRAKLFGYTERVARNGLVFYPYFPFGEKDPRFRGLPQVMTICDLFPLTNPEWFSHTASETFRRQLHGLIDVDHVICISQATQRQLQVAFPTLAATSSVAYLAADRATFGSGRFSYKIREALPGTRYFLCVGTIEPRKNLRNVIAAFSLFNPKQIGNVQLLIVGQEGWSITAEELQEMAGGMARRIRFLGGVSDRNLRSLYKGALCTIFCSLAEGFGLPIVESFACGTPVITSNSSSMKELAQGGAILVDPENPKEIADAIRALACDKKFRARLATAARAQSARFSWAKCADSHVREFLRLVEPISRDVQIKEAPRTCQA